MLEKIKKYILPYSVAIAIPLAVGTLSAFLTMENMDIYGVVNTPPLSPPSWLFPIAWTVLYILMGVSSAMVCIRRETSPEDAKRGIYSYVISLVLNFGWSLIFFNAGAFLFAFIWLCVMLYYIVRTVIFYFNVSKLAAYLQIPYIIWVAFAGYLNFGIFLLN